MTRKTSVTKRKQAKTSQKKSQRRKVTKQNKGWLALFWGLTWKCSLALAAVMLVVGFYLDSVVKHRIVGPLFDVSTVVYAIILHHAPGVNITIAEVLN